MKKVAVLGFGTVGRGVCQVLSESAEALKKKAGEDVVLGYICDLRDFPDSPYGDKHIKDLDIALADPEVAVVVELTGARGAAFELSKKALTAGKSVVTSNKEVVSAFGAQLLSIAAENGVSYLFEASVGGAIPIMRPLRDCLATDTVNSICGILNGTTNYILTRMEKEEISYEDALTEAQSLGYAEPNPTADVTGKDAVRKIAILGACISGKLVSPELIPCRGITEIKPEYIKLASSLGGRIKLLGRAVYDGESLHMSVEPCFVSYDNPLSFTDGVFNSILVSCRDSGDLMFYGRGAGSIPTAAAVVGDIADAINGCKPQRWVSCDACLKPLENADGVFAIYENDGKYTAKLYNGAYEGSPVEVYSLLE